MPVSTTRQPGGTVTAADINSLASLLNATEQAAADATARANHSGVQPISTVTGLQSALDQGLLYRGPYSATTAYAVDDLTNADGSLWLAKVASTGNAPPTLPLTENGQWVLWLAKGDKGDKGDPGPAGSGATWEVTSWLEPFPTSATIGTQTPDLGNMALAYGTAADAFTVARLGYGASNAGSGSTLHRLGLYTVAANGDLTLVASVPNDTTMTTSNFGYVIRSLSAAYSIAFGQRYAIGYLQVGGTAQKIYGGFNPSIGQMPRVGAGIGSASGVVTGQADLPASVAGSAVGNLPNAFGLHGRPA